MSHCNLKFLPKVTCEAPGPMELKLSELSVFLRPLGCGLSSGTFVSRESWFLWKWTASQEEPSCSKRG